MLANSCQLDVIAKSSFVLFFGAYDFTASAEKKKEFLLWLGKVADYELVMVAQVFAMFVEWCIAAIHLSTRSFKAVYRRHLAFSAIPSLRWFFHFAFHGIV